MSDYVIVTDSSADLSAEMVGELDVSVLPLSFILRGTTLKNYPDNRDMSPAEFYRLIREGEMPTTSAVNMQEYVDFLAPILEAGKDVLVLAFSSGPVGQSGCRRAAGAVPGAKDRSGGHPLRLFGPGPFGVVRRPKTAGGGEYGGRPGLV